MSFDNNSFEANSFASKSWKDLLAAVAKTGKVYATRVNNAMIHAAKVARAMPPKYLAFPMIKRHR